MSFVVYRTRRAEMRRVHDMACHVVRERDFHQVGGRVIDLSPDGMLVRVDEPVAIGESMIVSFRATDLGIWFDTDAIVTRCLRGRRPGDPHGFAIGVRFGSLDRVSRLILRAYLKRFAPPLPRRERKIDYAATVGKILSIARAA
jgi:hypothetical protein